MNRASLPNVSPGSDFGCPGQNYSQQRKMFTIPSSTHAHNYQNSIPMQWTKEYITSGCVKTENVENTEYATEALHDVFFQSGRNAQDTIWKQPQRIKTNKIKKSCMCSCTSGVPQCSCGLSRQQEKLKTSVQQNSLQWLGEPTNTQGNQIASSGPYHAYNVPSSTFDYGFFPDYPDDIGRPQEQAMRSMPNNNTASLLNNFSVRPVNVFSQPPQIQMNTLPPQYNVSRYQEMKHPVINPFPKIEQSPPTQCKASRQKESPKTRTRRKRPRLCHFILELLANPQQYSNIVEWVDREKGVFKFLNSSEVASQWGRRRDKPNMKYENFARSLRTYVAKGIMTKPRSKLVYRFTDKIL